jgi:hypothetical protein
MKTQKEFLTEFAPEGFTMLDLAFAFRRLMADETDLYTFRVSEKAHRNILWARSDAYPKGVPVSVPSLERRLEAAIEIIRKKESKTLDF